MRGAWWILVVACGDPGADDEAPTGCVIGDTVACTCNDGSPGVRTCITPPDGFAACGCDNDDQPDLFVPPPEPVPMVCDTAQGEIQCPEYRGDDVTEAGASHCCTADDACGSEASFLFGEQCISRDERPGTPSTQCPDEFPNFLDLFGCCRADGQCGLSLDHVSNWDIGCVERSEMGDWLNAGSTDRDLLSLVFFLPVEDAVFQPIACTP